MNMGDPIQGRVLGLIAEVTGVPMERLTVNTRLVSDIGLDGDDAVKFFEAFRKEFAVNLDDLYPFWESYFAREGITFRTGLLFAIPGLILGLIFTRLFPRLPDWLCFILAYSLWLVSLVCLNGWWPRRRTPQIAIRDLIDSAKAGRWTKENPPRATSRDVTSGRDAGVLQ